MTFTAIKSPSRILIMGGSVLRIIFSASLHNHNAAPARGPYTRAERNLPP